MLGEILGLPTHPLIVHAAVAFIPVLAFLSPIYAFVPRVRRYSRWAVTVLAFVSTGSVVLAKLSGDLLRRRLIERRLELQHLAHGDHRHLGNAAMISTICLAATALALVYVAPGRHPATGAAHLTAVAGRPDGDEPEAKGAGEVEGTEGGSGTERRPGPFGRAWTGWRGTWIGQLPVRPPDDTTGVRIRAVLGMGTFALAIVTLYFVLKAGHSGAGMVWSDI
jgi:hypothetical protein